MVTVATDVVVEELHRATCVKCSYRGELRADKTVAREDRNRHVDWHRRLDGAIDRAREYLATVGVTVLDHQWTMDRAFLAIVADDHGVLVVIDVRAHQERYGAPLDLMPGGKRKVMRRLGQLWLGQHGLRRDQLRVDVIGVLGEPLGQYTIEHVRGVG
jgi:Holliday junction resolvase-like predicted endonuclease